MGLTRRELVRLLAAAPLAAACDKLGEEVHIGSRYVPTPEQPLTPTDEFFVVHNFGLPSLGGLDRWRLRVRGLVDRPLDLSVAGLATLESYDRAVTMECIGNHPGGGLVSSATFTGVRLADLLAEAGVSGHARGVHLEGEDGYFAFLPVDAARADAPLIVTAMNGTALTPEHGAPVRALFPGRHGMFSVKWLHTITLTRPWGGYGAFTALSNVVEGVTPVMSRIDSPGPLAEVAAGATIEVRGLALTAGGGVARVEVAVAGAWTPAEIVFNTLDDAHSPHLWSLWRARVVMPETPGRVSLAVRAFDTDGRTQAEEQRFPYDSGGIHSLRVVVR